MGEVTVGECAVCCNEAVLDVLPCTHAFCFECVGNYVSENMARGAMPLSW